MKNKKCFFVVGQLHMCRFRFFQDSEFWKIWKKIFQALCGPMKLPKFKNNFFLESTNIELSYEYWSYEAIFNSKASRIIFSPLIFLSKKKIVVFLHHLSSAGHIKNQIPKWHGRGRGSRTFFLSPALLGVIEV